jgi:preprotein translocase subunit SecE
MIGKIKNFTGDVVSEMKKVSWPSKEQLRESTIVVVVVTAIITAFIFVVDQGVSSLMNLIF